MSDTTKPQGYNYVECGLPNVWLVNGVDIDETPYGTGVAIHDLEGLHACIGSLLVDKPEPLTGAEFRFLRRELDLSQRILGTMFSRDERVIRRWETGEAGEVPDEFDKLIRHMYQESQDPSSTFQGLIERLRTLDGEWHEMLKLQPDEGRWKIAS